MRSNAPIIVVNGQVSSMQGAPVQQGSQKPDNGGGRSCGLSGQAWSNLASALDRIVCGCVQAAAAARQISVGLRGEDRPHGQADADARNSASSSNAQVEKTSSRDCLACPDRAGCEEACEQVRRLLPGIYAGRGHREHLPDITDNLPAIPYHVAVPGRPSREVYEMLLHLQHIFLKPQWDVLELRHREGMTTGQIAHALRISPAAVRGRLRRAIERLKSEQERRSRVK